MNQIIIVLCLLFGWQESTFHADIMEKQKTKWCKAKEVGEKIILTNNRYAFNVSSNYNETVHLWIYIDSLHYGTWTIKPNVKNFLIELDVEELPFELTGNEDKISLCFILKGNKAMYHIPFNITKD